MLEIEEADELKKRLRSGVCFLDFLAFQVSGSNSGSWAVHSDWFTAKSWVCLAQRSDLRVI